MGAAANAPVCRKRTAGVFEWYDGDVKDRRGSCRRSPPAAGIGRVSTEAPSIRLWSSLAEDFAGTRYGCKSWFWRLNARRLRLLFSTVSSFRTHHGRSCFTPGTMISGMVSRRRPSSASLKALLAKIDAHFPDIPFGFISIKPSPERWPLIDRIRSVNNDAQAILGSRPHGVYLDVYTPMLSDNGGPRPELFQADGLHMNQDGYRIWWQVISARRKDLLL